MLNNNYNNYKCDIFLLDEEKFYKTPKFILTVSVASSVLVGLLAIILAFVLWPSSSGQL